MQRITQVVPNNFNLFLFGDKHEGSLLSHHKGWEILLNMMNKEYAGVKESANFGWDHGDEIEGILIDDKRYDPETISIKSVFKQIDKAVKDRKEMKGKLIGINYGNHSHTLKRFGNITDEVCDRLGVINGTITSRITYVDKKGIALFKHLATHIFRTINSTSEDPKRREVNMKLSLKRALKFLAGDTMLMSYGHSHKLLICDPTPELYIIDGGDGLQHAYTKPDYTAPYIHPDLRWYVNAGSFYKLYGPDGVSGYAERAGYTPIELGFAVVRVRDRIIEGIDKVVV